MTVVYVYVLSKPVAVAVRSRLMILVAEVKLGQNGCLLFLFGKLCFFCFALFILTLTLYTIHYNNIYSNDSQQEVIIHPLAQ